MQQYYITFESFYITTHTYTDINSDMNKNNLTSVHTLSVGGVDVLHERELKENDVEPKNSVHFNDC